MPLAFQTIVDISLELDPKSYSMRTPAGFKKDMQFEMEVLKEHDAPGGAGQIVRGVHMRLHAGKFTDFTDLEEKLLRYCDGGLAHAFAAHQGG